jgi:uncharacterized repeat protein (TIGR01451 family)
MIKSFARLAAAGVLALAVAAPAVAQSTDTEFTRTGLTREGTQITNVATATYTDANNNSYAQLSASATVTVGYLANLDIAATETQAPAGPSQDNTLTLVVTNNGNGTDFIRLGADVPDGATNVRYEVNGVTYGSLADLNAALATLAIEADGILVITVIYDVLDNYGGVPLPLETTITSIRGPGQPGGSDSTTTIITPVRTDGVNVAPDGATSSRLPSNGTSYTETYTVTNTGNATETYDLLGSFPLGAVMTIVSVNGTSGSGSTLTLAASASASVTVVYTVADNAAAGTSNLLTLTATAQSNGTITDDGTINVTVIRPAVTMAKVAFQNGRTVEFGTGTVLPGQFIEYRITVTNGGTTHAQAVVISDELPAQVEFVSTEGDVEADWTIVRSGTGGSTVTATLAGTLAPGASRHIWIRTQVR